MALTTRTSTSVRGPQLLFVGMALSSSQPSQADLDALAAYLVAGWNIISSNGVSASLQHFVLSRTVNTAKGA